MDETADREGPPHLSLTWRKRWSATRPIFKRRGAGIVIPTPDIQGGFDWRLFDTGKSKLVFSPNVAYFSRQFFSPFNEINAPGTGQQNGELQQRAYAKVNATLAWTIDRITLKAFINNAFNAKTYVYELDLRGAGFPCPFLVPASPRTSHGQIRVSNCTSG